MKRLAVCLFVETRSLASFWPAQKLKGKRWNMELDPWQPQLQQVFGEFRCGKTQLCLSLGLVTLDRLDQQGVVSAQSCEQVIFLMKRKEGEILHQCGKWWYDILLWDICQSSCCNIHFGLIAWAFLRPYLVCCLPAAYQQGRWWKQGTESKFPEVSLPEIAFWRLHHIFTFSNWTCTILFWYILSVVTTWFCFPCLLHPRTLQKCDVEICWNMLMASCFRWNVTKFWVKASNLLFVFRWHSR